MLDLTTVDWRHDRITDNWKDRNREKIVFPRKMTPYELSEAVTYCRSISNPYAEEMMRRSGHLEQFREAMTDRERSEIFKKSCSHYGIIMG